MKYKTTFISVLSIGLLMAAGAAQTSSGKTNKAKLDLSRLAPVRIVTSSGTNGKPVIVERSATAPLSIALVPAKAPKASFAATTIVVTATPTATGMVVPNRIGSTTTATTTIGVDTLVVSTTGAATTSLSANPLGASIERKVFVGDLARDASSRSLATGTAATASAATTTGETAIGPNGFPIFVGTAVPQSGTNPIGPNGFPQPLTNGPQAGIQPVGTDGFPIPTTQPFAANGLTRAGTARDATVPATTPVGRGATAGTVAAPNAATAVMSGPASVGATAVSSPR
jgi:hypothetical protein